MAAPPSSRLRGCMLVPGATLSSYSMGSPKPSVWTPDGAELPAPSGGDEGVIPCGAVSDVTQNAMQFGIGLFKPLQHGLRGALRRGWTVPIHLGSEERGPSSTKCQLTLRNGYS